MLKLISESGREYSIAYQGNDIVIDGKVFSPDIARINETNFHLLLDNKSFNAVVVKNEEKKNLVVEVNGNRYAINVKDQFELLLEELGMANLAANVIENIKAPMPGLVVSIPVAPGDTVKKNAPLLVLEAMKMENVIKAPADAVVDRILVKPKDAVEKGQVLITFTLKP